jgi:hypothetical protein
LSNKLPVDDTIQEIENDTNRQKIRSSFLKSMNPNKFMKEYEKEIVKLPILINASDN